MLIKSLCIGLSDAYFPSSSAQISLLIVVRKLYKNIDIQNTQGSDVCTCCDSSLFLIQGPLGASLSFRNTERSHYHLTLALGVSYYSHNFTGTHINKHWHTHNIIPIAELARCSVSWTTNRVFSGLVHCLCTSDQQCLWPWGLSFFNGSFRGVNRALIAPTDCKDTALALKMKSQSVCVYHLNQQLKDCEVEQIQRDSLEHLLRASVCYQPLQAD